MAKILLFNPPGPEGKAYIREGRCTQESGVWATQWPPVTLATAAALLEKDGHKIKVIDFPAVKLNISDLQNVIISFKPDIAIWNTGTPTLIFDLNIAKIIKEIKQDIITCVLGTHVSVDSENVLNASSVDIVIRGEPELPIKNLCKEFPNNNWDKIHGISYKDKNNTKIFHNIDSLFLTPSEIPPPSWHYLDINAYKLPLKGRPFLILSPIRGCPFLCNFCTAQLYYGKKLRKRPIANVISEIENSIHKYKIRDFFIWADTFTADKKYVKEFCDQIIKKNLKISWTCNSRVDTIDKDILVIMNKAGLWMISFGLESGNDSILEQSGKNITIKQSKYAVISANEIGIKTSGHFIFGLLGETEKTMMETLSLALELPLDIAQFYTASPFPGTMLYDKATKNNWLENISSHSQSHSVINLPNLPAYKVDAFRQYAYKKFYFRKKAFLNILSMIEPKAIKNILSNIKGFLKWIIT
ncbi:MAG: radical SAM protein [Desulfobacterales bacterium]|nr:radical SAM protein [Desulfobacterales bacterium]